MHFQVNNLQILVLSDFYPLQAHNTLHADGYMATVSCGDFSKLSLFIYLLKKERTSSLLPLAVTRPQPALFLYF
jgi:hypothetical protein